MSYNYNYSYDRDDLDKWESLLDNDSNNDYDNTNYDYDKTFLSYYDKIEIDKILDESRRTRDEILDLSKYKIKRLPTQLKEFDWIKTLHIKNCALIQLSNLPKNLEYLDASNNSLSEFKKEDFPTSIREIELEKNIISEINDYPENITSLNLSDNELNSLPTNFPASLITLLVGKNKLNKFSSITSQIIYLDISSNNIESIESLNNEIEALQCSKNKIYHIKKLPTNLKILIAYSNKIRGVYSLPESIEELDISHNEISWIPTLPNNLKNCDLSNNRLRILNCNLPEKLISMDLTMNTYLKLPTTLENDHRIKFKEDDDDLELSSWDNSNVNTSTNSGYNSYRYDGNYNTGYYGTYNNYNSYGSSYGGSYGSSYGGSYGSSYSGSYGGSYGGSYSSYSSYKPKYGKSNPNYIIMKRKIEI